MQPFLDGCDRHLQERGDLVLRVVGDIEEDGRHALVFRKFPHGSQYPSALLLLLVGRGGIGVRYRDVRRCLHDGRGHVLAARLPVALREYDALEPAGEGLRLAQLVEIPPCGDERFLCGVLGEMEVAEHAVGARERQVL